MMEHLMKPKGPEGFWADVHTFLTYLYTKYPQDMQALELQAQVERDGAFNKYASDKARGMRKLGIMPDMLDRMLVSIYGKEYPIPRKKFEREFFRRYRKLRVTDTI